MMTTQLSDQEQEHYARYAAMDHDELARLASKMQVHGILLEHMNAKLRDEYNMLHMTCEKKLILMGDQAEAVLIEKMR